MKSASLIRWASLEERRRKQQGRGLQAWPDLLLSLVLGGVLAAEVARRLLMAPEAKRVVAAVSASHLWVAVAVCCFAVGVFGAPFRLYWRRDSKLLASLPVPGKSLFALAVWRSQRTALLMSLALGCALLPIGALVSWELAMRHVLPLALGFVGAAWLGPGAARSA